MSPQYPIFIIFAPLTAALVISVTGWWSKKSSFPLAVAALGVSFFCSVLLLGHVLDKGSLSYHVAGWPPPVGIAYKIDHLGALMLALVSFLGLITAPYADKSVKKELPNRVFLFWCLYLLLITGLLGILVTADLFNLFVLLEVASLTGYALVAVGDRRATVAGFRYLIIGTIGACFYLLGVGYLYIATGTLNMADLAQRLPPLYESRTVITGFIFILTGFAVKIALFPLHAWQPDAYTHAPSAVTIIISTAAAKTFAYALIRVIFSVFTLQFVKTVLPLMTLVCWLGACAIIMGSVRAIAQDNLKRMLAYSSVANAGYIVLGVGLSVKASSGLTPAVVHILNHALIKGAMFMAACGFIHRFNLTHIKELTGIGRKMPYSAMVLIVAALAMVGLPPGAGFVSKWYLILAALEDRQYLFVAVIFISTLLMLVYFWRMIETIYIRPGHGSGQSGQPRAVEDLPMAMLVPSLILAALTFVMGLVWISGALAPLLEAINLDFQLGGAR